MAYISEEIISTHEVYHKFGKWLTKHYGEDLYGEWQYIAGTKFKYRFLDEEKLSKRLVGYDVMYKVERYVKRYLPEIKVIHCDDAVYSSSIILLIPHPTHGITIMFIPNCTDIQNQFFLYENHFINLMSALSSMSGVYGGKNE